MEKVLQGKVISHLKALKKQGVPIFWEKRQAGGFNYKKGLPDIYIVLNGRHIELELKTPNKTKFIRPEQLMRMREFELMGVPVLVSNDLEEIKTFIRTLMEHYGLNDNGTNSKRKSQ